MLAKTFRNLIPVTVILCFFCLGADRYANGQEQSVRDVDFSRDIKPLLSDRCFHCHGPDEAQVAADLRLDIREWATEYAIVPGDPEASVLIERLVASDPEERMPPAHSNKEPLSPAEVQLVRDWIKNGAEYTPHWSYQPLDFETHSSEHGTDEVQPENQISPQLLSWLDDQISSTASEQGLTPVGQADPRTLIRRLSFDLTGLPPSRELVEDFAADPSEANYRQIVDTLISSPAFGERMAVYWLDQVRYADTNGIHGDNHRDHDLYRDYVIRSFNENLPFDQFTIEQLAGDLLPNPTTWQRIASGYNRLNMTTREGGAQPKEYITKYASDRVRNVSSVWMGSTIGCAECHNHKYDPFTQEDFYSLAAFFADVDEIAVGQQKPTRIPTPDQELESKRLAEELSEIEQQIAAKFAASPQEFKTWISSQREALANQSSSWFKPESISVGSQNGTEFRTLEDDSIRAEGKNPARDIYSIEISTSATSISAIRLDTLTDASFPKQGLSRANGNFVLSEVELHVAGKPVSIREAIADFSQDGYPIANVLDQKPNTGWAVSGHVQPANHVAIFILEQPLSLDASSKLELRLIHQSPHAQHQIGRFRIALSANDTPRLPTEEWPARLKEALAADDQTRDAELTQVLQNRFQESSPLFAPLRQQKKELADRQQALANSYRPLLITKTRDPLMVRVLPRGDWLNDSGELVAPDVPDCLPELEAKSDRASRLDLAHWLVDSENPLVSRVFVNRLWKIAFGEGLVRSPDDFGSQGNWPSHPEILDRLATEFIRSNWDVKKTLKTIVLTQSYRRSSNATSALRQNDPTNSWLARQNSFRLDAEFVRDNALATSGLLQTSIGGPSVRPYQPAGYWEHLNFPKRRYKADQGPNQYRRGLYTYWCRTFLHPSLLAFDAPTREECTAQRNRSNTPLQALVLLNDPSYVEAAVHLAKRIPTELADDQARIAWLYSQALQRDVREDELDVLLPLLNRHREEFRQTPQAAEQVLGLDKTATNVSADDATELAAWTNIARVVLNLHETITRY